MVFKVRASDTLVNYSVFLGLFHGYMLLNFFVCFTPAKLSHINSLLDHAEEPRRVEGSSFLSHTSSHSEKHRGQPRWDTDHQQTETSTEQCRHASAWGFTLKQPGVRRARTTGTPAIIHKYQAEK